MNKEQYTDRGIEEIEAFDPREETGELSLRPPRLAHFGDQVKHYVQKFGEEGGPINVYLLLCPDYPYDASARRFAYNSGKSMGSGLSPTVPQSFSPHFETFLKAVYLEDEHLVPSVKVKPLVCDIEADLPNVVETFAGGDVAHFHACAQASAQVAGDYFATRFPYLEVDAGTFNLSLQTPGMDLDMIRGDMVERMRQMLESDERMKGYRMKVEQIAEERIEMFRDLYGVTDEEGRRALAFRQMVNYLAVIYALSMLHPEGSIVFNLKTPNSYYVSKQPKFIRDILDLPRTTRPPAFHFI